MRYQISPQYGVEARYIAIDAVMVPLVGGRLVELLVSQKWVDYNAYVFGYNCIAELLIEMATSAPLIAAVNRVYMAVRQMSAGERFGLDLSGNPPELPLVPPDLPSAVSDGLISQVRAVRGYNPSSWPLGIGAEPTTLHDIAVSLRQQSPQATDSTKTLMSTLAEISVVEGGVSSVTGVLSALGSWLSAAEVGTGEGLMLAALLAQIATNVAIAEKQKVEGRDTRDVLSALLRAIATDVNSPEASPVQTQLADIAVQLH